MVVGRDRATANYEMVYAITAGTGFVGRMAQEEWRFTPELIDGLGGRSYADAVAGDMTYDGAMEAAAAQGAGNWVLDTEAKTLTLRNVDGSTFCVFDIDNVSAPTTRTRS